MSESTSDDDAGGDLTIPVTWKEVKSAFSWDGRSLRGGKTANTVANAGATAGSIGVSAAQLATQTHSLAVAGAIAAGVAVSATGIGLVVAGAVLTLGSMMVSGTSMVKSTSHVIKLKKIRSSLNKFSACKLMSGATMTSEMALDHAHIGTNVLSYIIDQKTEKSVKKGVGMVPGAGLLTNVYRLGRYLTKTNRGGKRNFYAQVLTRHLITHDCALAGAIVSELFSVEEMLTLRQFDSNAAGEVIAKKMKSV